MQRPWARSTAAGALALALCAGPALGQVNVVANGGFESGLASWTTSGFVLLGFDFGVDNFAHSGTAAFFGGAIDGLGFLQQSVATQPGTPYDVDFWLASDGFLPNRFQVIVDGNVVLDREDILLQPYGAVHTSFVATGALTQLGFGFRNDSGLLHFDDVRVAAIPEPSTIALMGAGLGVVAFLRRRRRA
jgi:hypothetical protein